VSLNVGYTNKGKKVPYVWCHYIYKWVPMGRAKKHCPSCGAVIKKGESVHQIKKKVFAKS